MTSSELLAVLGFKVDQNSLNEVNNQVRSLKSTITKTLGVIGIGLSLRQMNALIESFNQANDSLRGALDSTEDLAEVTEKVRKSANSARISYEQMANSVSKTASLDIFNTDEAVQYSENLAKLLQAYGHGDYVSSVQQQLNRIMQTGQVSSGFTRMLANTPEVLELMAKQLGTTKDKLAEMAKQGKITAQTIKDAFLKNSDDINEAFSKTDILFTDALKIVRTNWGYFLNELNDATGIGNELGHFIVDTAEKVFQKLKVVIPKLQAIVKELGGGLRVLKLIAAALATLKAMSLIPKVVTGLEKIRNGLNVIQAIIKATHIQLLPMIAIFTTLFLLVEDFIGFMTGKNSALEHWLEAAGIDADEFRESIRDLGGKAKSFFEDTKSAFQEFWKEIEPDLKTLINDYIGPLYASLLPMLVELLGDVFDIGKDLVKFVLEPALKLLQDSVAALNELLGVFQAFKGEGLGAGLKKVFGLATDKESAAGSVGGFAKSLATGNPLQGVASLGGKIIANNLVDDGWFKNFFGTMFSPGGWVSALTSSAKGTASAESVKGAVNNEKTINNDVKANQVVNNTINVTERDTAKAVVNATNGASDTFTKQVGRMLPKMAE